MMKFGQLCVLKVSRNWFHGKKYLFFQLILDETKKT